MLGKHLSTLGKVDTIYFYTFLSSKIINKIKNRSWSERLKTGHPEHYYQNVSKIKIDPTVLGIGDTLVRISTSD
jgi:hypothetical protein